MLKLIRNYFELGEAFCTNNVGQHEKIVELQEKEQLHLVNQLTRKHLQFRTSILM